MTEGLVSQKVGHKKTAGDRIELLPDQILTNEMLAAIVIPRMKELETEQINKSIEKETIKCFMDHGGLGTTPTYVDLHQSIREFCAKNGISFYEPGVGIGHILLTEIGAVVPGDIIVGTDSHTTTHGALNTYSQGIGGSDLLEILIKGKTWLTIPSAIHIDLKGSLKGCSSAKDVALSLLQEFGLDFAVDKTIEFTCPPDFMISSRQTIANMVAELGATSGIFPFDTLLKHFLTQFSLERSIRPIVAGSKAIYVAEEVCDLSTVIPMVAKPHRPNNVVPASELSDIIPDQVYIGSCTNSRIEDLRIVAKILRNNSVQIKTLISPGSHSIFQQAENEGLIKIFLDAGCQIVYPGCNACFGGSIGLLGKGMIGLSTTNRNFEGRMGGDETTNVYLASPATAAASAISGNIIEPEGN
jgi:3-isopropylmalate/(R)-2-methylmalate dehydratase large subunit